eukprot:2954862-Rhodomonas_salina.3
MALLAMSGTDLAYGRGSSRGAASVAGRCPPLSKRCALAMLRSAVRKKEKTVCLGSTASHCTR